MPSRTGTPPALRSADVAQRHVAVDTMEKPSKQQQQSLDRSAARRKSYEHASLFWKLLVKNLGELEAKQIMHHLMGDKRPGRPKTDETLALTGLLYAYILRFGLRNTDGQIASHIFDSSPCYLQFESGAVAVTNSDFTEAYLSSPDDPVVERKPFKMSRSAIKKSVERLRRWAIEEGLLAKSYAPRPYRRD